MDKLKKFIDVYVPVTSCTLRCDYCYITHNRLFDKGLPTFKYDVDTLRKGLSKERLGGVCLINFCGGGETLLPPEMPSYIRAILEEGHYVMVVTNATVDRAFDEIAKFPKELLQRLFFKFSYHYLQLKQRNLMDRFFANIHKVIDAGASFTLEATPSDEWVPYIDEMKERAIAEVGAPCHITVARDERDMVNLPILTQYSRQEYSKIWSVFDSKLFEYKLSIFGVKRKEFCYAGEWVFSLNMGDGMLYPCYCSRLGQNILDDVTKPIKFQAIGCNCPEPHCHNGHVWLGFGAIPTLDAPTYAEMRNRICPDGSEWLKPKMKAFMSQKLYENNEQYSFIKKAFANIEMASHLNKRNRSIKLGKIKSKLKWILKKK